MIVAPACLSFPALKLFLLFTCLLTIWSVESFSIVSVYIIREDLLSLTLTDINEFRIFGSFEICRLGLASLILLSFEGVQSRVLLALIFTGERDTIEVKLIFNHLHLVVDLLSLFQTVFYDGIQVSGHSLVVLLIKDDFLSAKLDH